MLKININNLKEGEHEFGFSISPEDLGIDEVDFDKDIVVIVRLYKSGNQFHADINLTGIFKLECDRCLDEFDSHFSKDFEMIYKYDFAQNEIPVKDEDIKFINPNSKFIDLKEDIRDYLLLSVPMRKVPGESKGECNVCHREVSQMLTIERPEEINPVWEKLIKAKIK